MLVVSDISMPFVLLKSVGHVQEALFLLSFESFIMTPLFLRFGSRLLIASVSLRNHFELVRLRLLPSLVQAVIFTED